MAAMEAAYMETFNTTFIHIDLFRALYTGKISISGLERLFFSVELERLLRELKKEIREAQHDIKRNANKNSGTDNASKTITG
jgi:hypothetical protein